MSAAEGEVLFDERLGVVDAADDGNGVGAQVGPDQQRLGVGVADAADGRGALHILENMLKLGAEGRVLDVVDLPLQADLGVIGRHTAPAGAEMRMIVRAEENIGDRVVLADDAKKTAHK